MTHHRAPKRSRSSDTNPDLFSWYLQQHDFGPLPNPPTPPQIPPLTPRGGGGGGGRGGISRSSSSSEVLSEGIRTWLIKHDIANRNWLIKSYSAETLRGAIEDFERETHRDESGQKFTPRHPSRFFRSLLVPPPEPKPQPAANSDDPDKFIKGKYGHMVRRFAEDGGEDL